MPLNALAPPVIASVRATSPCLIMLGGLGDLLITLPIAYHYAQLHGTPTPVLTSAKYQNILAGCSYVRAVGYEGSSWRGYTEAIAWARARFPVVHPLHVGDAHIRDNPRTTRFCHEQYLHAGVPGRYGDFPLIFDRRNPAREAALVKRVRNGLPLLLYNFEGRSSPFDGADALHASLQARWAGKLQLVNIPRLDLSHFQDLLGLLDASIGLITIDTATMHLMPASPTPYIALVNDTKTPWWSSVPRGACALQLGYIEALPALPLIHDVIAAMLAGDAKPIPAARVHAIVGRATPAAPAARPHLLTLAHGPIERVWSFASRTWQPWLRARSLTLDVATRLPRPDLAPSWNKLPLVLAALEKHDVVWWIDADITVARATATLPDSNADLLFSTDWNGLCGAMFRARATEWTRSFLRAVLLLGDVRDPAAFGKNCGIKWEQNAFKALLATFPSCASHVAYLPRDFITDTPLKERSDAPHSFNHFGGLSNQARIAAIRQKYVLR